MSLEPKEVADKYEYAFVVTDDVERNEAFRKADAADQPVMWIQPYRKYGDVTTDCITAADYEGLEEASVKQVRELVERYMGKTILYCKESHRPKVMGTIGGCSPGMRGLLMKDVGDFASQLAKIYFDFSNWQRYKNDAEPQDGDFIEEKEVSNQ